jgi:AcrR family transcriptional regulator
MAADAPRSRDGKPPSGEGRAATTPPSGEDGTATTPPSGERRAAADAAAPRSRRDRPAKPALSREAIVDAALDIARAEGVEALSMRRLAQALDTGPASLYVYVANQGELWELLFDAALATVATEPTDPARWREQLHALAARIVHMMAVEFPGMARLAMTHIPGGDNSLRVAESMLALLRAGGVSDQAAAYAVDLIGSYITAIGYEQSLYATLYTDPQHQEREVARIAERFANLDPERYPTIVAVGEQMTAGDGEERFALGLDVIVNGLLATPTEGRLSSGPPTG